MISNQCQVIQCTPTGLRPIACLTPLQAVRRVLERLYDGIPLPSTLQPNKTPKQSERNAEIRRRYAAGESLVDLATSVASLGSISILIRSRLDSRTGKTLQRSFAPCTPNQLTVRVSCVVTSLTPNVQRVR